MANKKFKPMTNSEIVKRNKSIENFMWPMVYKNKFGRFNNKIEWLLDVVDHIERIGPCVEISSYGCGISWWYSPKKTGTFSRGGGTVNRNLFDAIFGKHYSIYCRYRNDSPLFQEQPTKLLALFVVISDWIEWYNKTIKKVK